MMNNYGAQSADYNMKLIFTGTYVKITAVII